MNQTLPPWERSPQLKFFLSDVLRRSLGLLLKYLADSMAKAPQNSWENSSLAAFHEASGIIAQWIDTEVLGKEICPICSQFKNLKDVSKNYYWAGQGVSRVCYKCMLCEHVKFPQK